MQKHEDSTVVVAVGNDEGCGGAAADGWIRFRPV